MEELTSPYRYTFTPGIVGYLQAIERARTVVGLTILPPGLVESLRLRARLRSTHFSTRIEGNRLSLAEAEQVIIEGRAFRGRERDTREVKQYYQALEQIDTWVESQAGVTEERVRKLHAIIYTSMRAQPTPYRDGQNVIRDGSGGIVYLPPEAKDVPSLMAEMVDWFNKNEQITPVPVAAGIVHYQFVTIHPFFDGNGRAARALATWILHRGGYDLGGLYALEEFYTQNLQGYYDALMTHSHHNYYEGRATADITPWIAYFLAGMASVFTDVAQEVQGKIIQSSSLNEALLRKLDRRGRLVLGLFSDQDEISSNDVARILSLSHRQARELLGRWVNQGWLEITEPSRKMRRYRLSAEYRRFIGGISAGKAR